MPALAKQSWQEPWLQLLRQFHGVMPTSYTAFVLADRGLWAKWLFEGIIALGWHPPLRIHASGSFRPRGWVRFRPLRGFTPRVGLRWSGRGTAFATKGSQLPCTPLACWGEGHAEAWRVLTDLEPWHGDAGWYGWRAWIEQGFKDGERGGWQWQQTRMTEPGRAARLWLVLAVATWWLARVGGVAEEADRGGTLPELRLFTEAETKRPRVRRWRLVSVFRRGWVTILAALIAHRRLPLGRLLAERWPPPAERPAPAPANAGAKQVA